MKAEQWAIFWAEIDPIRGWTETNDAVILLFIYLFFLKQALKASVVLSSLQTGGGIFLEASVLLDGSVPSINKQSVIYSEKQVHTN